MIMIDFKRRTTFPRHFFSFLHDIFAVLSLRAQGYSLGLVVADSWTHLEIALIYNALLVDLGFSAVFSHQARARSLSRAGHVLLFHSCLRFSDEYLPFIHRSPTP
jgi:hypothetical protein